MTRITTMRPWRFGAAAATAALGLSGLAMAQVTTAADGSAARSDGGTAPPKAAAVAKSTKSSLADSISAAEKHCGGRAVRAECCDGAAATGGEMCKVTVLVGETLVTSADPAAEVARLRGAPCS